jgi:glycosyltransferase involved in cell wall biosynthesis
MIIVNLSNVGWAKRQQRRNQAIFRHLLLDTDGFEEGFFIQPPQVKTARTFQFSRAPELAVVARPTGCGRPVTVLQPVLTLPSGYPQAAARKAIADLGQKLVKEIFRNKPYLLWINSITHFQAQIAEQLMPGAQFRVFDGSEMLKMYERNGDPEQMKLRAGILKGSDVSVCADEHAMARLMHPAKHLMENCTEFDVFQRNDLELRMEPLFPKPPGAVYIGFTGMLTAERIDFDLMHAVMTRFPRMQFIFAGSTKHPSLLARLKTYPNFHHVPEQQEETLAAIIRQFDVAIVPDLDNEYTRAGDGLEVLNYLACGVPVLSSISPVMEKFGESVYVAPSVWEFSHSLERLATKARKHEAQFGLAFARQNSWCQKVPAFVDWLFDHERDQVRSGQTVGERVTATLRAYL